MSIFDFEKFRKDWMLTTHPSPEYASHMAHAAAEACELAVVAHLTAPSPCGVLGHTMVDYRQSNTPSYWHCEACLREEKIQILTLELTEKMDCGHPKMAWIEGAHTPHAGDTEHRCAPDCLPGHCRLCAREQRVAERVLDEFEVDTASSFARIAIMTPHAAGLVAAAIEEITLQANLLRARIPELLREVDHER